MTQTSAPAAEPCPVANASALAPAVEAVLLASDKPLTAEKLAAGLRVVPALAADAPGAAAMVEGAIEALNESYASTGRVFRIERVAGGYRLMTLPSLGPILWTFYESRQAAKLSRAAIETLAVVAYRQPITRAELESIRGVSCGEVLRALLDRRLVTIQGRAEELGRPILYATTREFLDAFGLSSIKDLPAPGELGFTQDTSP